MLWPRTSTPTAAAPRSRKAQLLPWRKCKRSAERLSKLLGYIALVAHLCTSVFSAPWPLCKSLRSTVSPGIFFSVSMVAVGRASTSALAGSLLQPCPHLLFARRVSSGGRCKAMPARASTEVKLSQDELKKQAAWKAVDYVKSGMKLGLGTGSTAAFAVDRIGQLLKEGTLKDIVGVPTSIRTYEQALSAEPTCSGGQSYSEAGLLSSGSDCAFMCTNSNDALVLRMHVAESRDCRHWTCLTGACMHAQCQALASRWRPWQRYHSLIWRLMARMRWTPP